MCISNEKSDSSKHKRRQNGIAICGIITAILFATACMDAGEDASASPEVVAVTAALSVEDITLTVSPHNSPVVMQPEGGNVDFTVAVSSSAAVSADFDLWTTLTLPDGAVEGPLFGPADFVLPTDWVAERMLTQTIDASEAPGEYQLDVVVGIYPDTVYVSEGFPVTKVDETVGSGWVLQDYDNPYPVPSGVHFVDDQTGWVVGSRNNIIHTDDGGDNWYTQTSPVSSNFGGVYFVDASTGWAVGTSGKIIHTTDGGENWTPQESGTRYTLNGVFFNDANKGWIVGGKTYSFTAPRALILYTPDGGNTWVTQLSANYVTPLQDIFFADETHGVAVGDGGVIYATTDGGSSWNAQSSGVSHDLKGVWFTDSANGWVAGINNTLLKTTNGGATWTGVTTEPSEDYDFSSVVFPSPSDGWIAGGISTTGAVLHTNDGGITWTRQETEGANYLYDIYFTDTQNGWAAGLYGTIIHTESGGE